MTMRRRQDGRLLWMLLVLVLGSGVTTAIQLGMKAPVGVFDGVGVPRPSDCPPCFNCMLPAFECKNFGECNPYDGRCKCPPGFGGDDCLEPLCGSLPRDERPIRTEPTCACDDGWGGVNCNVCQEDYACNALMPQGINGTCYKGGLVQHMNFQSCDVVNKKILSLLGKQKPEVTFRCETDNNTCAFEFWVDQRESFYCGFSDCTFEQTTQAGDVVTDYKCQSIECSCIPDRMLCGENGSVDLSELLSEEIKGPGSFRCSEAEGKCYFDEPAMNQVILDVFGDNYIELVCDASECLYFKDLPGYVPPVKEANNTLITIATTAALVILCGLLGILWYLRRPSSGAEGEGRIQIPDDEDGKLMQGHVPTSIEFAEVSYQVSGKIILDNVQGRARPGQIMAIMGASGAGKTTFLDILAFKAKMGEVDGRITLNGKPATAATVKRVSGFVDQDDRLMATLTVYETVLYSALLRLPATMSYHAKVVRVMDTLSELGILRIKDHRIGEEGRRGISGGEKRRVSIACELVTSPSILFLDEPTSGLDSYNAWNVIECLKTLATDYKRTIVLTIHQPRSNIFSQFDQLVLLGSGKLIYSGPVSECRQHFSSIGYPCPIGFNIADYIVDLSMKGRASSHDMLGAEETHLVDPEDDTNVEWATAVAASQRNDDNGEEERRSRGGGDGTVDNIGLAIMYQNSIMAEELNSAISEAYSSADDRAMEEVFPGHERINALAQMKILSERALKNVYRNPQLMLTHYMIAILISLLCGFLFFNIPNDISGFQNRLGLLFFILALFGFSTLTSLQVFASERLLYMRERANGYYSTWVFFVTKVIFDMIPLRVIPAIMLSLVVYPMVGFVPHATEFFRFVLVLVLFNLTSAAVCLWIGIVCSESSLASLVGSLYMLFSLLFAGLLLNRHNIPPSARWVQFLSIFHYAFEALLVNEVRYLDLVDHKYGLDIEVPGATILSTFGFTADAYWSDTIGLAVFFAAFILLSYGSLRVFVYEQR